MRKSKEFYEEEDFDDIDTTEHDAYSDEGIEDAVENDEMSAEDAGFMDGYNNFLDAEDEDYYEEEGD